MNRFELFTLMYFVLDAYYEDEVKENDKLSVFLGDMNPFVWEDCISGDPAMYSEYCDFMGKKEITLENSLKIAKEYIKTIDFVDVTEAFQNMKDDEWIDGCTRYLSSEHKGAGMVDKKDINKV